MHSKHSNESVSSLQVTSNVICAMEKVSLGSHSLKKKEEPLKPVLQNTLGKLNTSLIFIKGGGVKEQISPPLQKLWTATNCCNLQLPYSSLRWACINPLFTSYPVAATGFFSASNGCFSNFWQPEHRIFFSWTGMWNNSCILWSSLLRNYTLLYLGCTGGASLIWTIWDGKVVGFQNNCVNIMRNASSFHFYQ